MVSEEDAHCCTGSKIHDFFFFLQILMSYKLNEKNLSVLCLAYDGKK